MLRFHGPALVFALAICGAASASTIENVAYNPKLHLQVVPPGWSPPDAPAASVARSAESLAQLPVPSYAVLVRGEDLDPKSSIVDLGDALVASWIRQGLVPDRHAVMIVAWSEDCGKPKEVRRPGHTHCDYAITTGWALRQLGIEPARDIETLGAPFHKATDQSPRDVPGGIYNTLQGIAQLEQSRRTLAREEKDGSRAHALASADRTILLAKHFLSEGRDDGTLRRLVDQAVASRGKPVSQITDADESLRTYLDSLIRIDEVQNDHRLQQFVEVGILVALVLILLAFLGLRARRRWDAVAAIRDPVRAQLLDLRSRTSAGRRALEELEKQWAPLQSRLGSGPQTVELAEAVGKDLHDLNAVMDALTQHVRSCETLLWQVPIRSFLRLLSPCPAQVLERQLRASFPVSVSRAEGFSLVFNSNLTRIRVTTEEAEKLAGDLHARASLKIQSLLQAQNTPVDQVLDTCSRRRVEEVAQQAELLGVPPVWYSTHPLKNRDIPGMQSLIRDMYALDPITALASASKFHQGHMQVVQRVEAVAEALASVSARRTPSMVYPADVRLDPDDDPKLTIAEAEEAEIKLSRLVESPEDPTSVSAVQAQAAAAIRLYNKALAQHEALYLAQAQLGPLVEDLKKRQQEVNRQFAAFPASSMSADARNLAALTALHMQSASLGIAQAAADAAERWVTRAYRVAAKARAELAQAERCVAQLALVAQPTASLPDRDALAGHLGKALSSLGSSLGNFMASSQDGGTSSGTGGGSGGGGGTSTGGGSGGGGGTSTGGGSK